MKKLSVLRHAKSSWNEKDLGDFNRPLNDRGWKDARRIGREMKRRRMQFDLVVASPAARVRETIDGIEEKLEFGAAVRFEPQLYLADLDTLLSLVRSLPEEVNAALLVGHNPGLEELLLTLTDEDSRGLHARIESKYPTGALAVAEISVECWGDVGPRTGMLVELILPKDLD